MIEESAAARQEEGKQQQQLESLASQLPSQFDEMSMSMSVSTPSSPEAAAASKDEQVSQAAAFSSPTSVLSPPPFANNGVGANDYEDEGPTCWICLEGSTPSSPLRRNCSCRGDSAGFAHIACLADYAQVKCREINDRTKSQPPPFGANILRHMNAYSNCPNCKKVHQGDVHVDLAMAFVDGTAQLPTNDPRRWEARLALGGALHDHGDLDGAQAQYRQIVAEIQSASNVATTSTCTGASSSSESSELSEQLPDILSSVDEWEAWKFALQAHVGACLYESVHYNIKEIHTKEGLRAHQQEFVEANDIAMEGLDKLQQYSQFSDNVHEIYWTHKYKIDRNISRTALMISIQDHADTVHLNYQRHRQTGAPYEEDSPRTSKVALLTAEHVKTCRAQYEFEKKAFQDAAHSVKSGVRLCEALVYSEEYEKATQLVAELIDRARTPLGPDHPRIKQLQQYQQTWKSMRDVHNAFESGKVRLAVVRGADPSTGGDRAAFVMRYTKDNDGKFICINEEFNKFKVHQSRLKFNPMTPVYYTTYNRRKVKCRAFGIVEGYDSETGKYGVRSRKDGNGPWDTARAISSSELTLDFTYPILDTKAMMPLVFMKRFNL